jgi:hypothetical protein
MNGLMHRKKVGAKTVAYSCLVEKLARQSFANVQCSVMWRQQNASGPLRITYS